MRIESVDITNLLSYERARFDFRDYNVVVGPNNAGKTNLLRILRMARDKLGGFSLRRDYRHDRDAPSRLALGMSFTDREFRAVLQSVLLRDVRRAEFPAECRELQVLVGWDKPLGSESAPANTQVHFRRGISAVFDHGNMALFDTGRAADGGPDEIFRKSGHHGMGKVMEHLEGRGMSRMKSVPDGTDLGGAFSAGAGSGDVFTADGRPAYYTAEKTTSGHDETERVIAEINEVVGDKWDHDPRRALGSVLHAMASKSTVFVEEKYPSLESLTETLFELMSHDNDAYDMIRKGFGKIFGGTDVQVEMARGSSEKTVRIKEGGMKYPMRDAASGHYAALHILHAITGMSDSVILLDEPETHFHPGKVRHLSRALMDASEKSGNQVVLLTHSPEFVDPRILYSWQPYTMTVVSRSYAASTDSTTSTASTLDPDAEVKLKAHLLDPRIFFGRGSLLVEGADDAFAIRGISDALGSVLDMRSVTVVNCMGRENIDPYMQVHDRFGIPCVGMADSDYKKRNPRVTRLKGSLEDELKRIGWAGAKKDLSPDVAYTHLNDLAKTGSGRAKLEKTRLWVAFSNACSMAGIDTDLLRVGGETQYYNLAS